MYCCTCILSKLKLYMVIQYHMMVCFSFAIHLHYSVYQQQKNSNSILICRKTKTIVGLELHVMWKAWFSSVQWPRENNVEKWSRSSLGSGRCGVNLRLPKSFYNVTFSNSSNEICNFEIFYMGASFVKKWSCLCFTSL